MLDSPPFFEQKPDGPTEICKDSTSKTTLKKRKLSSKLIGFFYKLHTTLTTVPEKTNEKDFFMQLVSVKMKILLCTTNFGNIFLLLFCATRVSKYEHLIE